jgi:hypothetical protein
MANQLAHFIRMTEAKEVTVCRSQVAELLGEEQAEELAIFCTTKLETRTARVGPRSAIPPRNRVISEGLAAYDRLQLLEAIESVHGAGFQATDKDQPIFSGAGTPNPMVTPASHVKKLQDRGLLPS